MIHGPQTLSMWGFHQMDSALVSKLHFLVKSASSIAWGISTRYDRLVDSPLLDFRWVSSECWEGQGTGRTALLTHVPLAEGGGAQPEPIKVQKIDDFYYNFWQDRRLNSTYPHRVVGVDLSSALPKPFVHGMHASL